MLRYAFVIGAFLTSVVHMPSTTLATQMDLGIPPAKIDKSERVLGAGEVTDLPSTLGARKYVLDLVERAGVRWSVDMGSETVAYNSEFGFVYRYNVSALSEHDGASSRNDFIFILWAKDREPTGVAIVLAFDVLEHLRQ